LNLFCSCSLFFAATVIRDEVGLTLDGADKEVLGSAAKVVLTKDSTTIVGDGSTQEEVTKRVAQIRNLIEVHIQFLFHTRTAKFYDTRSENDLICFSI